MWEENLLSLWLKKNYYSFYNRSLWQNSQRSEWSFKGCVRYFWAYSTISVVVIIISYSS